MAGKHLLVVRMLLSFVNSTIRKKEVAGGGKKPVMMICLVIGCVQGLGWFE
jgi:hypothetical protein